jgi:putative endonuclease
MRESGTQTFRSCAGSKAYHTGLAAEETVARQYDRSGSGIVARRWRGKSGEIDLIARDGDAVVFIEVKAAATHEQAAQRFGITQQRRIYCAAAEFLAAQPLGALTPARFDVALVDRMGQIEIMKNAFAA